MRSMRQTCYEAWARRVHPDDLPRLTAEAKQLMQDPQEVSSEYRAYGQNDELRWLEVRGRFERGADGRLKRYFGVVLDITERKRAEERDRILTAEVNHRAKNLLAVVQAVALQTARSDTPEEFARNFNSRLSGLACSISAFYSMGHQRSSRLQRLRRSGWLFMNSRRTRASMARCLQLRESSK